MSLDVVKTTRGGSLSVPSIRTRLPNWPPKSIVDFTPATLFTAICARTISRVAGVDDVVFGRLVAGRAMAVAPPAETAEVDGSGGMATVAGPCNNFVPICVDDAARRSDLVRVVHEQLVDGMEHEGIGLHQMGIAPRPGFGFTVQYQNHQNMHRDDDVSLPDSAETRGPGIRFGWRHGQKEDRDEALFEDCVAIRAEPVELKDVETERIGGSAGEDGWDIIVSGPEWRMGVMKSVSEEITKIATENEIGAGDMLL